MRPKCMISLNATKPGDGWCDDPCSANYNQPITLPFAGSHEYMTRVDRLYDVCFVLDYNIHPVKRCGGSAIFFHLTSETRTPTLGCIAVDPIEMKRILPFLTNHSRITVLP